MAPEPIFATQFSAKPVFAKPVFAKPVFAKPRFAKPVFAKPILVGAAACCAAAKVGQKEARFLVDHGREAVAVKPAETGFAAPKI